MIARPELVAQRTEPDILAVRETGDGAELDLRLSPELLYFQGHFPETPILPGVVQLHWALHYGHKLLGLGKVAPSRMQLKFRRVIVPGKDVLLCLARFNGPEQLRLTFTYSSGGDLYSQGSITLVDEHV